MSIKRTDFTFTSSTGDIEIHAAKWIPDGDIKAIFQITHGMAEHIERYVGFAEFLAQAGYAVYAHDHIGHGASINDKYIAGYFGQDNAEGAVFADDCAALTAIAKSEYPGKPVIFFGHSMGSFVARRYGALYGEGIDGLIICGTGGPNPAAPIAIAIATLMGKIKGVKAPGNLINNLAFGAYNNKTDKRTAFDWLTKDTAIVDKYIADPLCGFVFSYQGFRDMLTLLKFINTKECYDNTPAKLPILLVAGADDPVGEYTKGVITTKKNYAKGKRPVTCIFYDGDRHEILNEFDKDAVMADILEWADCVISK